VNLRVEPQALERLDRLGRELPGDRAAVVDRDDVKLAPLGEPTAGERLQSARRGEASVVRQDRAARGARSLSGTTMTGFDALWTTRSQVRVSDASVSN